MKYRDKPLIKVCKGHHLFIKPSKITKISGISYLYWLLLQYDTNQLWRITVYAYAYYRSIYFKNEIKTCDLLEEYWLSTCILGIIAGDL